MQAIIYLGIPLVTQLHPLAKKTKEIIAIKTALGAVRKYHTFFTKRIILV